jgi:hypothetical protein
VNLLEGLISGIGQTFVTLHDSWQSRHPISSVHRTNNEANPLQKKYQRG